MTVDIDLILAIVFGGLILVSLIILLHRKRPKKLRHDVFAERWKDLQKLCKDKSSWPQAITEADTLLDKALKRRRYKGKSMGERMVSAQRVFSNNDAVWYAHNLSKKVKNEPELRLKESDVKGSLLGFRQALRDLGALPGVESKN
ncbi:hypothetical protein BH23PAT1_BH23PAT1_3800 [soil metagenome]